MMLQHRTKKGKFITADSFARLFARAHTSRPISCRAARSIGTREYGGISGSAGVAKRMWACRENVGARETFRALSAPLPPFLSFLTFARPAKSSALRDVTGESRGCNNGARGGRAAWGALIPAAGVARANANGALIICARDASLNPIFMRGGSAASAPRRGESRSF